MQEPRGVCSSGYIESLRPSPRTGNGIIASTANGSVQQQHPIQSSMVLQTRIGNRETVAIHNHTSGVSVGGRNNVSSQPVPPIRTNKNRYRTELFEDADFPATDRSVYRKHRPSIGPITWLRPHEICPRPRFCGDSVAASTLELGELGDTWLLFALNSLCRTPKLLERVVPSDQDFEWTSGHAHNNVGGQFRFRFWHFGDWIEVVVDDRLPTYCGRLVTLHSMDPTEFWPALLEKAYAKFYGSYEQLGSGSATQTLQDLTGGIVQNFHLASQDRFLSLQLLNSALPRATFLVASVHTASKKQLRLRHGLMTRLAYSIVALVRVRTRGGEVPLVRLQTAEGKGEWSGPWSDRSWEWDSIKEVDRPRAKKEDEFWMSFDDFVRSFTHLDVVHVGPDDWMSEPLLHSKKPWRAVIARRRWRAGYNAGGGPAHIDTVTSNPQFRLQIPLNGAQKCHVVVSVTQFYDPTNGVAVDRKRRFPLHPIGFAVYEVPYTASRITMAFVMQNSPLDVTNHSVSRETVTFFTLRPGDYVVIPCTRVPDCETKFLLRIYTDEQSTIWEVNDDNMILQSIPLENGEDNFKLLREGRAILAKCNSKFPSEVDAHGLQKIFRLYWKTLLSLPEKPSLELCRAFIMLKDSCISGRVNLSDVPGLMRTSHLWQSAFLKFDHSSSGRMSSYNLRSLLWETGVSVSNKVLECLVLRFVKQSVLTSDMFLRAMVRLYVAHERYRNLNIRLKTNPLTLEEVILMTVYS